MSLFKLLHLMITEILNLWLDKGLLFRAFRAHQLIYKLMQIYSVGIKAKQMGFQPFSTTQFIVTRLMSIS